LYVKDTGCYRPRDVQLTASQWQLALKKWHCVLPEGGTHVPKHVGEFHLMFVLIKYVHLVGKQMVCA